MEKDEAGFFVRNATGLVREIGAFDSFVFNFLSMNPFGVFVLMVFAIGLYQSASLGLSTALALVPALPIALVYVMLSVSMPRTGGDYVWVSRIIHPIVGFIVNFGFTFVLFTFIAIDVTVFTQWGIGAYFYGIFANTGDQGALGIFSALNTSGSPLVFGIAVVLILLMVLAAAFGTRNTMRIQKAVWVFVVLAAVVYLALALSVGHSAFIGNFNSHSGTNETAIVSAATSNGFNPTVTLSGTLLGFVFMFLNFTGFNFTAYLSGEVKNVRRTQLFGILASLVAFAALLVTIVVVTESVFGYNFFHALDYLFDLVFFGVNPSAPYPSSLPPAFPEFLVGFLTSNPVLIFIITFGFGISALINAVPYMQVSVRNIFAWSFDRAVPGTFSRVDGRFHTPYVALMVTAVLSVMITYLSVFTTISLLFTYTTFLFALLYFVVGLAAVAFPFRRKDVFDASPGFANHKIGGLPLVSLLGALAALASFYIGYSLFTPEYSGPFVLQNFEVVIGVLVAPAIIYVVSHTYYRRKGLNLGLMQKEIPPE